MKAEKISTVTISIDEQEYTYNEYREYFTVNGEQVERLKNETFAQFISDNVFHKLGC